MKTCALLADYLKSQYFDNIVITSKALENIKHDANSGLVEIVAFVKEYAKRPYPTNAIVASAIYRNGVAYVANDNILSYNEKLRDNLKEFIKANNLTEGIAYSNVIDYTNLEFEILSLDDESAKVRAKLVITFHSREKLELISDVFRLKTAIIDITSLRNLNDTLIELTRDFQDIIYSVARDYPIVNCYHLQSHDDTLTERQYGSPYILEENCELTSDYLVGNHASAIDIDLIHTNNGEISEAYGISLDRIHFIINNDTEILKERTKQIISNKSESLAATNRIAKLLEEDFVEHEEMYLTPELDKRCKIVAGSSEISTNIYFDISHMTSREIEINSIISLQRYGEEPIKAFKQTDKIKLNELDKNYYMDLLCKIRDQIDKIINNETSMAEHRACIEFSEMYKFYRQSSSVSVSEFSIEINNSLDLVDIGSRLSKLVIMGAKIEKFNDNITLAVAADKLYVFCNSDTEMHIRLTAHAAAVDDINYKELDGDKSARVIVPVIKSALFLAAGYDYSSIQKKPNEIKVNIITNGNGGLVAHVNKLRRWTHDEPCGDIRI